MKSLHTISNKIIIERFVAKHIWCIFKYHTMKIFLFKEHEQLTCCHMYFGYNVKWSSRLGKNNAQGHQNQGNNLIY